MEMEATTAGADEEDERPSPRAPEGAKRRWRWSQLLTTMKVRWLAKGICEDDFLSDQQDLTECLNKVQIYVFGKILKRKKTDDQAEDDHREDDQPQDDTKGVKPAASAYCASRELRLNAGKCGNEDVAATVIDVAKVLAAAVRDVMVWRCVGLVGAASEHVYIKALDDAFEGGLSGDKDLKAQLLNSFHHELAEDHYAFKSHSSQRRKKRPRKNRRSPPGSVVEDGGGGGGGGGGGEGGGHGQQAVRARSAEPMAARQAQCHEVAAQQTWWPDWRASS